ncbi:hypothetical protein PAECIP111802_01285 [Paenibacillus allorhizosphaerae]|uniref:Histidine phosphatase family protein n=1 Tax=Paenibacillus allorhizosphaerae TaxID=2849866 RepID=A0ABM8VDA3_9BACL|nr:hypothetical protein PAECIP111802_01285 [Paenibacillus allorhizosphaerae]
MTTTVYFVRHADSPCYGAIRKSNVGRCNKTLDLSELREGCGSEVAYHKIQGE